MHVALRVVDFDFSLMGTALLARPTRFQQATPGGTAWMTLNWLLDLYRYPRNAAREASMVIVAFVIFN
jgi:hypothetical protein